MCILFPYLRFHEQHALVERAAAHKAHHNIIQRGGRHYAHTHKQTQVANGGGDTVGGCHHGESRQRKRHYVGQNHAEAVTREPADKVMPHEHPQRVKHHIYRHHGVYAVAVEHGHENYLEQSETHVAHHICAGMPLAHHKIGQQCAQRHERSANAENLDEHGAGLPLVGDGDDDELVRHQTETEQHGE